VTRYRYGVAGLLVLLFGITYLDRVCISVVGPRMQQELQIGPVAWGWVSGVFTIAYCVFEIPSGLLGDLRGPRRVLTRIVTWWSAFTALTGAVTSLPALLGVRFLFGAGEAGAFPNASIVVSRWFPPAHRATMSGVLLASSQIGGALAPLLVVPIQIRFGWRMAFYVVAALGVAWAIGWYLWFRDSPAEMKAAGSAQSPIVAAQPPAARRSFPWHDALRSPTVLALLALCFCYVYVYNFFQTWFHTFLVKGRGFDERSLWLSALPFVVAACSNLAGGIVSDALVRRLGPKLGRRVFGSAALAIAGAFAVATMLVREPVPTVLLLAVVYGGITFQQSGVFGVCLDIAGGHAGTMTGLMNTTSQLGGLAGAIAFGYLVERFDTYDAPFVPMAALLLLGSLLWLRVDASKHLDPDPIRP
jgi:ACS family glucarate transporter-like MFS transporter